ncbi:MAG: RsmB/NOP family class I SAM-dependent RNA methyltransferase [Deltaproteobacteria bacterium]|nr:RsmB/NOP family class I SAM-dependent RNA methyltransferase [Deltaproteobacteria bacterium]
MTRRATAEPIAAAARLYVAGVRAHERREGPLDSVVARFLREELKGAPDDDRGVVVDLAQGMWRRRRLLQAVSDALLDEPAWTAVAGSGRPTKEMLACIALVLDGVAATSLPIDRRAAGALAATVTRVVAAAPLDVRASLSPWLCERLVAVGGEALALSSTTAPPQTLRVNTLKATREACAQALAEEGIDTVPCVDSPCGLVVTRRKNVFRTVAFSGGWFEVQDEGSQRVAALARAQPGQRVVDGCAGAGGKTLALAAAMQSKGTLLAFDVHGGRLKALRARCTRAGVDNVRVHDLDEEPRAHKRLHDASDVVLVDAPCSGTGVLRRNPDTAWTLQPDDVVRLVQTQAMLIRRYAALVKPGGRLVYATCSVLPEENRGVVGAFLADDPRFALAAPENELVLLPTVGGGDGFYAAALTRR